MAFASKLVRAILSDIRPLCTSVASMSNLVSCKHLV